VLSKIADGVYHAVGTGNLGVGANAAIIVNDDEVLIVDSHVSATAAWALLRELRAITTKPVKYVVNTHFHYDHAHGNQFFGKGVEIIGHEFTRAQMLAGKSKQGAAYEGLLRVLPQRRDSLQRVIDTAQSADVRRAARTRLLQVQRYQRAVDDVRPTAPNVTLNHQLTLRRGSREIRILFLGRGHTGGDVVVYLPAERVLVTGDQIGTGLPYLGDGYLDEWATTLGYVDALPWDVILPGHGQPVRDHATPGKLASLLRDIHRQSSSLLDEGLSFDVVEQRLDLSSHITDYPALADRNSADVRERLLLGVTRIGELRRMSRE